MRRIRLAALLLAALLVPVGAVAQTATLTGFVRNQSQEPVRGAAVMITGANLAAVTNDQGFYQLQVPGGIGRTVTLTVQIIGYRPAQVEVSLSAAANRQDVMLVEQAISLDEIVVTGTAGRQSRRAQAAVVSTLKAAEVAEVAPVSSMQQLLQSRLPGVSVQTAGGTIGGTQVIRMRGQASIALSNDPLIFIDGIRMDQRTTQLYAVGGQQGSRLNDLRPEDIEDIEIVKGPAAAALYGADASAGVINIITKRGRQNSNFTQTISTEYHRLDWDQWEIEDNWAACSTSATQNEDNPLCYGQEVGTLVHDNPLVRTDAVRRGSREAVTWSGQGGGANHSYYVSLGGDREEGAFVNNDANNVSATGNFEFQPTANLRINMMMNVIRDQTRFPRNDNDIYGWIGGAMLGSPNSLGTSREGWYAPNRQNEAIAAYENYNTTTRSIPRLSFNYSPFTWMTNRLLVGADLGRAEGHYFYPKNDKGWYSGVYNTGQIGQSRNNYDRYTVDYLGNITNALTADLSSDLSFGTQLIFTRSDRTNATGIGLTTNSANAIDQAAETTGGQTFSESRQIGFFGQWQVGFRDRLFVQMAGRLDQHSAFGTEADPFFSPKVGVSWVASDEPFWRDNMPDLLSTFRLRAAYGTTGRSPTQGALATYTSSPFAFVDGGVGSGVMAEDLGNPDLRPERGTEVEAGFEVGMFEERLGVELTYFHKTGTDVILRRPLPSSWGVLDNQLVNIGEVLNAGFEVSANARLITSPSFGWDVQLGFNTLESEVVDMGGIESYATGWAQEVREGYEAHAFFTRQVEKYIVSESDPQAAVCTNTAGDFTPCAIVTNELEYKGPYMPTFEGNFSQTMTFFRRLRLYGQVDWKDNFYIYNNTDQFRERQFGQGERWVRRNDPDFGMSDEDRIQRFGPFFEADLDEDGNPTGTYSAVSAGSVSDAYVEAGDFVRFRELSLSYAIPETLVQYFRATSASITAGGRNLALWSDYNGPDPEVSLYLSDDERSDFLTLPSARSFFVRLSFQF